jgi:ankyrin repeat protein
MIYRLSAPFLLLISFTLFVGCAKQAAPVAVTETKPVYTTSTLITAVSQGDVESVKKHLLANISVNSKNALGNSLVHLAVISKDSNMLQLLLEHFAEINTSNEAGMTPFHLAVQEGELAIVKLLIDNKAKTSTINSAGNAAIHTATKSKNIELVKLIISEIPTDVNLKDQKGLSPFLLAVKDGNFALIQYFLKNKANLADTSHSGLTATQLTMSSDSLKTLDFLIKKGAKLNQVTKDGQSLLHLAAQAGSLNIIKFLVKKGIKADVRDRKTLLALNYAVNSNQAKVVSFLLTQYSKLNDAEKRSMLKFSIKEKNLETLLALHKGGVLFSLIDPKSKDTLLHYAISLEDSAEVLALLLKHTKLIEHKNSKGLTAMAYAKKLKKDAYVEVMKPYFLKVQIAQIIAKNDFPALKKLYGQFPEIINLVKSRKDKLSLDGPKELMIGDIKILTKKGRSQSIIISQIKRLKTAYKHLSSAEIGVLVAYGLPAPIISAIIDKTASVKEENLKQKESEALKALQNSILTATTNTLQAQEKTAQLQELTSELMKQLMDKQDDLLNEQSNTTQALQRLVPNESGINIKNAVDTAKSVNSLLKALN